VVGIVVEQAEPPDAGFIGELDALLPARMPPAGMRRQFLARIGRVEDQERNVPDQIDQLRIGRARADLDIGGIGQ
jgi:hypothetical protein